MDAKELKVGNYIERYSKVTGERDIIRVGGDTPFLAFESMTSLQFNPIPLTEEWLLKFGFKKDGVPTGYTINDKFQIRHCWLNIIEKTKAWNFEAYNYDNWIGISKPQYVHQIQNLYFALTGEELLK